MGVAVSHKLKMDQQFGNAGETFSVLNTIGINTTFPSNRTAGRLNLGWSLGGLSDRRVRELQRLVSQLERLGAVPGRAQRELLAGRRWAERRRLHDGRPARRLHFGTSGMFEGMQVYLDASNVLDEDPPFVNAPIGFDPFNANPIGRLLTVGVSKKW